MFGQQVFTVSLSCDSTDEGDHLIGGMTGWHYRHLAGLHGISLVPFCFLLLCDIITKLVMCTVSSSLWPCPSDFGKHLVRFGFPSLRLSPIYPHKTVGLCLSSSLPLFPGQFTTVCGLLFPIMHSCHHVVLFTPCSCLEGPASALTKAFCLFQPTTGLFKSVETHMMAQISLDYMYLDWNPFPDALMVDYRNDKHIK